MSVLNPIYVIASQSAATTTLVGDASVQPGDLAILIANSNTTSLPDPTTLNNIVNIAGVGTNSGWSLDLACPLPTSGSPKNKIHIYSKVLQWTDGTTAPSDFTGGSLALPGAMKAVGPSNLGTTSQRLMLMIFRDPAGFSKVAASRLVGTATQIANVANGSVVGTVSGAARRCLSVIAYTGGGLVDWTTDPEPGAGSGFLESYCNQTSNTTTTGIFGAHYGTGAGSNKQADFRVSDSAFTAQVGINAGLNNTSHAVAMAMWQINDLTVPVGMVLETGTSLPVTKYGPRSILIGTVTEPSIGTVTAQTILPSIGGGVVQPAPTPRYVISTQSGGSATLTAGANASPGNLGVFIANANSAALPNLTLSRNSSTGGLPDVIPGGVDGWNLDQACLAASGSNYVQIFSKVLTDEDFLNGSMLAVGPTGYVNNAPTRLQLMIFSDVHGFDPDPALRVVLGGAQSQNAYFDFALGTPIVTLPAGTKRTVVVFAQNGANSQISWDGATAKDPYCDESSTAWAFPTYPNGVPGERYGSNSSTNQADFKVYSIPQVVNITLPAGTRNTSHALAAVAYQASDSITVSTRIAVGRVDETSGSQRIVPDKSTTAKFVLTGLAAGTYSKKTLRAIAYLAPNSQAAQLRLSLYQGSTLLQSSTWFTLDSAPTAYELLVTATITDYSTLRAEVTARTFTSGTVRVSQVEFELATNDIGTVIEGDVALPIGRGYRVGTVTSTESSLPVAHQRAFTIGMITEDDSALPIRNPIIAIGMVVERSRALVIVPPLGGAATSTADFNDTNVDFNDFNVDFNGNIIPVSGKPNRWQFADRREIWPFEINPSSLNANFYKKASSVTSTDLGTLVAGGRRVQPEMTFSGTILSQYMLDQLDHWFEKGQTINLVDDLRRVYTVYITEFSATRVRNATNDWKHTFECRVLVLDGF